MNNFHSSVVEYARRVVGIEVKLTDAPGCRHTTGLKKFLDAHPDVVSGILVHSGTSVRRLDEKIVAMPWTRLTG